MTGVERVWAGASTLCLHECAQGLSFTSITSLQALKESGQVQAAERVFNKLLSLDSKGELASTVSELASHSTGEVSC